MLRDEAIGEGEIEALGQPSRWNPAGELRVSLVVVIGQGFDELGIPPGSTTVLGRACRGACDAPRRGHIARRHLLDADAVNPVVAEIVRVAEARCFTDEIFEPVLLLRLELRSSPPVGIGNAEVGAVNRE